jgi:hypothetical protein
MVKVTEPVSTMSSGRRDKSDKGKERKAKQDGQRREDRLIRRSTTTSGDGLDAAVTSGAVAATPAVSLARQTRHSSSLSPPTGKDLSKARSATNSPVLKRAETLKRTRQAESSESSDDECSEAGASIANIADAGVKLKKRSNIQVESNFFYLTNLKHLMLSDAFLVLRPPLLLEKIQRALLL